MIATSFDSYIFVCSIMSSVRLFSILASPVVFFALILSVHSDLGSTDDVQHLNKSTKKASNESTAVLNPEFMLQPHGRSLIMNDSRTNVSSGKTVARGKFVLNNRNLELKLRKTRQLDPTQGSAADGGVRGTPCRTDDDCNDDDFACFKNQCKRDTANRRARQAARLERQRQKQACRSNPSACGSSMCQTLFDCPNRQPCINGKCSALNTNQGSTNTAGNGGDGIVVVNIIGPNGGSGGSVLFNQGK